MRGRKSNSNAKKKCVSVKNLSAAAGVCWAHETQLKPTSRTINWGNTGVTSARRAPHPKLNDRWRPERVLERLKRREGTHRGRANGRISAQYWLYVTVRTKNHNRSTENTRASFFSSRGSLLVYKVCCVCEGRAARFPAAEVDPWHQSVCLPAPLQSISNSRKKEKKKKKPSVTSIFSYWFPFFFLGWQENKNTQQ